MLNTITCRPEMQCLHAFGLRETLLILLGLGAVALAGYIAAKTW